MKARSHVHVLYSIYFTKKVLDLFHIEFNGFGLVYFCISKATIWPHTVIIHQTRETVFHLNIQTPRRQLKIRRVFLTKFEVFWMSDETLSRVLDISSQSKQKLRNKWRSKIVKIFAYYDRVSKPS